MSADDRKYVGFRARSGGSASSFSRSPSIDASKCGATCWPERWWFDANNLIRCRLVAANHGTSGSFS